MIEGLKTIARRNLPARIYGPLRARRVRRFIERYQPRTVQHQYAGFQLCVHLEDPLAEAWYDGDWEEPAEITQLRLGKLGPGATVFDIGAHQGVVALILARIVGEAGRVVAVEAEPHNAVLAQRNALANRASNMTVMHAAAGSAAGTVSFIESLNGRMAPRGRPGAIDVAATTVDELAGKHGRPDVVFVDVEGFEAHVLRGAKATIAAGDTDFFIELHPEAHLAAAGSTAEEVFAYFTDSRFDVRVAMVGDTPPGLGTRHLLSAWEGLESGLHTHGERCFVVVSSKSQARSGHGWTG